MNPDETTLALWLDDELTGANHAACEAWALTQPTQLAAREELRRYRALMASTMPATEDPPYPDFFNRRIAQAIREQAPGPAAVARKPAFWKSWLMPAAACAGMAFAFWIGAKSQAPGSPQIVLAGASKATALDPFIYTPETGVNAEFFPSDATSSNVIVLNGVNAIPDSTDFSATTFIPQEREFDATADSN